MAFAIGGSQVAAAYDAAGHSRLLATQTHTACRKQDKDIVLALIIGLQFCEERSYPLTFALVVRRFT
jgi:hypothetical protein